MYKTRQLRKSIPSSSSLSPVSFATNVPNLVLWSQCGVRRRGAEHWHRLIESLLWNFLSQWCYTGTHARPVHWCSAMHRLLQDILHFMLQSICRLLAMHNARLLRRFQRTQHDLMHCLGNNVMLHGNITSKVSSSLFSRLAFFVDMLAVTVGHCSHSGWDWVGARVLGVWSIKRREDVHRKSSVALQVALHLHRQYAEEPQGQPWRTTPNWRSWFTPTPCRGYPKR